MWDGNDARAPPKYFQVDLSSSISCVSFSLDGSRFVSGSNRGKLQIWEASLDVEEISTTLKEREAIRSIAISPSGKLIASASSHDRSIYLWNVISSELISKLILSSEVISVAFSCANEWLIAFVSKNGTVQVWDVTNAETIILGKHMGSIHSVAFSPDGKHVASGSSNKSICIWSIEKRSLAFAPIEGHFADVCSVAYSPKGGRLVSGSHDKTVRIWDPATGWPYFIFRGHFDFVSSVAYSDDESYIVSGSRDTTILVWDAKDGQILHKLFAGTRVLSVCFSLDGKRILSGYDDRTVCVWDVPTSKPLSPPIRGHTSIIYTTCFFPDNKYFATGSEDGTIRIWASDEEPNDISWHLRDDNWVVGRNGELMMWIPTNLRNHLCHYRNLSTLNRSFYFKLHFGPK